jgi:hypothetical protein
VHHLAKPFFLERPSRKNGCRVPLETMAPPMIGKDESMDGILKVNI